MTGKRKKPGVRGKTVNSDKALDKSLCVDLQHHHDCPFFLSFLNASADPVLIINENEDVLFVNQAFEELFGIKADGVRTYKQLMTKCWPEESVRDSVIEEFRSDMKSSKPAARLRAIKRPDGTKRWFYRKVKRMPDGNIMMIGQDVTALQEVQVELEHANYVLQHSSDAVFWIDCDGNFTYVNERACKSLGYTKKQLFNMAVFDVDPLYTKKTWPNFWKHITQVEVQTMESIHKRKDGSTFPVELSVNYDVFDGNEFLCAFARDVSERKKSDIALLESEENLRELSEMAFEAIVIHDNEKIINANRRFYDMYGYTEKELRGKDIVDVLVASPQRSNVKNQLETGDFSFYETTHFRKDGSSFPVEVRVRAIEYGGRVVRAEAILDVSDRLKTQQSLIESELQFKNIVESSPIGMYIYRLHEDDKLILIGANPAADKMVGLDHSEKVGLDIGDAFPGLKRTEIPERYREVARTGVGWHSEMVDYEDNNIKGAFEVHAFQTAPNEVVVAFLNITERKSWEAELKQLAAAVESAAESIIVTDAEAHITYVNPWFETMTGYSRAEVLKKHIGILQSGEHDAVFYKKLRDTLQRRETWRGRFINKKKNGTLFEEDAVISPVVDGNGDIVNYVAVKRDVTQEVMLGNQVMQSQKMAAIGQLAHKIAHNFTNMLVIILGNAQMAKEFLPKNSEAILHIDEVVKAANRVSTLTSELLSFAHPEELQLRPRKLNKALHGIEDLLKETVSSSVELIVDVDKADFKVNVDAVQIEQALLHLAINADEAMGKKAGVLTISAAKSDYGDNFAMITVSDTGQGFSEDMIKQIFDPFFSTKESKKNAGLGLATVYTIVNQHKGFISVDSKVGIGTTFKIYLPLAG